MHAWFLLNRNDDAARALTYLELIELYRWDSPSHTWKRRVRELRFLTIGRRSQTFPKDVERFYLRILLQHARGPTSFEEIRTVNGRMQNICGCRPSKRVT